MREQMKDSIVMFQDKNAVDSIDVSTPWIRIGDRKHPPWDKSRAYILFGYT